MEPTDERDPDVHTSIPNVVLSTALTSASISVALGAICLALLSLMSPQRDTSRLYAPEVVVFALLLIGVALVFNAALTIDWIVDRFDEEDWLRILGRSSAPYKADQFLARLRLFNGGYFLLCLGMAGLSFAILSQAPSKLGSISPVVSKTSYIISALFSGYIIVQMMTYKTGKLMYAVIAFLLSVGIVLGASIFGAT
ncbi:MAG: hypothetical protein M3362_27800 [Acidobacteriota bacterium]|nr:hypothetical protein [Acidobacteriota bacterium]